jgi:hypothetical protein
VENQATALLIKHLELGFKNKDEEMGFRKGLDALPYFWRICVAQVEKEKREESERTKKEKKRSLIRKLI